MGKDSWFEWTLTRYELVEGDMFGYRLTMQSLMRRRGDRFDWRWTTPGGVMKRGSRSGWSRYGLMEESRVKRKGHSGMMEG